MKGVYINIEKDELKEMIEQVLLLNAATVNMVAQTAELRKWKTAKNSLQKDFLIATEELDLEIEKLKSFMPEVKIPGEDLRIKSEKPSPFKVEKTAKKGKYQEELDSIKKRLEEIRKK